MPEILCKKIADFVIIYFIEVMGFLLQFIWFSANLVLEKAMFRGCSESPGIVFAMYST